MAKKKEQDISTVKTLIGFPASGKWRKKKVRKGCRLSGGNCLSPDSLLKIQ